MARLYAYPFSSPLIRTLLILLLLVFIAGTNTFAQTVTSFIPSSGPVGTEITITGAGFTEAHTVTIGAGATYDFSIVSDSEIKVKVPASASNGIIRVISNQGSGTGSNSYTVVNAPVISSITPSSGPVGTEVTITGSNFSATTAVSVGSGSTTNFTIGNGGTEIKVIVPASASSGSLKASSSQGASNNSSNYTLINAPIISNFSPSSGPVGTEITITGSNFSTVTSISIGSGSVTNFTKVSDTELKVTVPSSASTGSIRVTSNQGSAGSSSSYSLVNAPIITSFSPSSGPAGTEVVITGSNFTGANLLYIGNGQITNYTVISATEIRLTIPPTASTGTFFVRTPNGQVNSTGQFKVTGAPVVTSFTPSSGPIGQVVTITGQGFTNTNLVYFGNSSTNNFTVISDTQIQIAVPTTASSGRIQVRNNNGTGISSTNFIVTGAPIITSFSPSSGPAGTEVVITGSNFTGANLLYIGNGQITNYTVISATEIRLTIPPTASTGTFFVRTPNGQVNSTGQFTKTNPFITLTSTEVNFSDVPVGSNQVKEYHVSGLGLKNGEAVTINLSTASPYTISTNAGSGFGKSVTLNTVSNNKLNATSIFVKYDAAISGENTDVILHQQGTTASKSLNIRGNAIAPLPVEFLAFNAVLKNGQVNLSWSTASEKDNSHFEIEKASGSLSNFRKIDAVKSKVGTSATTTNYSFSTYYNSNGATEYYRLKQVDLDGTPKYSKVVSVKPSSISKQMEVAPNPINEDSKIYFTADADGKAIIKVTSVTGKQIYFEQIDVHGGENAVQLSKYSKLMPSVYIVTVEHDGKRESVRIEKK